MTRHTTCLSSSQSSVHVNNEKNRKINLCLLGTSCLRGTFSTAFWVLSEEGVCVAALTGHATHPSTADITSLMKTTFFPCVLFPYVFLSQGGEAFPEISFFFLAFARHCYLSIPSSQFVIYRNNQQFSAMLVYLGASFVWLYSDECNLS